METKKIPLGFLGHVVEFWPILDEAKRIGMPVSKAKIDKLEERLLTEKEKINNEIQQLVPKELKNLEPKRKIGEFGELWEYGYKKPPKQVIKKMWDDYSNIQNNWNEVNKGPEFLDKIFTQTFSEYLYSGGFKPRNLGYVSRQELDGSYKNYWVRIVPFKPSSKQVIRYIKWKGENLSKSADKLERRLSKKYRVPILIDRKKGIQRETTGAKHLRDLLESTGDEVILRIIGDGDQKDESLGIRAGLRSIDKVIKNDIVNWQPASDFAVHTTWGLKAASGQLDSRSPNILNASKHTVLGKIFREVIECSGDEILVEADKKSYHVATMGYCSNDKDYIRFSQLDPHSYFTAYVANGEIGLPNFNMDDREILEICKRYKNDRVPRKISPEGYGWTRQNVSKIIVLGNQLGLGATKAYLQNRKSFKNPNEVKILQDMMGKLFPKVENFKKAIKKQGDGNKRLVNEWGYQQWFWEIFAFKFDQEHNQWFKTAGTEAEKAIAFPVQSLAFGDIRDKLIQLRERGLLETYKFISSIHDSFIFKFPRHLLDNFMADVYPILVSPSRRLVKECCPGGLVVGVEVSWGKNFASYNKFDNPEGMRELK